MGHRLGIALPFNNGPRRRSLAVRVASALWAVVTPVVLVALNLKTAVTRVR